MTVNNDARHQTDWKIANSAIANHNLRSICDDKYFKLIRSRQAKYAANQMERASLLLKAHQCERYFLNALRSQLCNLWNWTRSGGPSGWRRYWVTYLLHIKRPLVRILLPLLFKEQSTICRDIPIYYFAIGIRNKLATLCRLQKAFLEKQK